MGVNGGLPGADMRILQITDRKINIVAIEDHELSGLDAVTAAAFFTPRKDLSLEFPTNMFVLEKGDPFMQLDKWNGLSAKLMADPKLWEVPKELKPLMDMCSHSLLNLDWSIYTPSGFLLMMIFNNTLMNSLHHLTFQMLLFWIMVLPLHFFDEINQEADDSLLQDSILDEFRDLQQQVVQQPGVFWDSVPEETGEHTFHAHCHECNPAEQDWIALRPYVGWQSEQVIQSTYKVTSRFRGTVPQHDYLKKHFTSRNPVFNIPRKNELLATDTVLSDTHS